MERNRIKKQYFSMLELTLSIAVLAIGIAGVITLFPVGVQKSSSSIGTNYSAIAADNMHTYLSREGERDWTVTLDSIPTSKPEGTIANTENWGAPVEGNIYKPGDTSSGVYAFKITAGNGSNLVDFTGQMLVWRNPSVTDWHVKSYDNSTNIAGIYIEVSYPVTKPYTARHKNKYYFELFNPSPKSSVTPAGNGTYSVASEEIGINPGNSAHEFVMQTPDGEINRDTLHGMHGSYTYEGTATELTFKPKGSGNTIEINGTTYNLSNRTTYTITSSDMNVKLDKQGNGMGNISVNINAAVNVTISPDPTI